MARTVITKPDLAPGYKDPKGTDYPYIKLGRTPDGSPVDRLLLEHAMIRAGGYVMRNGERVGEGLGFHYKAAIAATWPHFDWIPWTHLLIDAFATEPEVTVQGPASSTKTYCAAAFGLQMIWAWKSDTTVLMSTTTRDQLDMRVWGAAMELVCKARERRRWLPGKVVAAKHRFTTADDDDEAMPADKRDGIVGIACRQGDEWVGISNYVGLKNKRVVLIADEAHLMAQGFLDSIANLRNNPVFKLFPLGNPKDPMDPLGKAAEPRTEDGGWDSYVPEKKTKTWRTRSGGLAIQLCGLDSPNYRYGRGLNPFPYLITPEVIEKNVKDFGEDSLNVSMMCYGIMPRTGAVKRIIDLLMGERNRAFEEPVWAYADKLVHVAGLDAAYSGTGGDRCVWTHLVFGPDLTGKILLAFAEPQIIIPINPAVRKEAEVQIAEAVAKLCMDRGIPAENFGLDSTGRGTLVSALARNWSVNVVAIEFGGEPSRQNAVSTIDTRKEFEVYQNEVTAIWYGSRLVIESGQLRKVPRQAIEEGQLRSWDVVKARSKDGNPLIQAEPKHKMKLRAGRSPDLWDSFCVALKVARLRGFEIAGTFKVGVEARTTPRWLLAKRDQYRANRRRHELTPV